MSFSDQQLRTIKCDNPDCDKIVTFDIKDVKAIQLIEWLKGVRVVQTGDNRALSYCSDVCEVKGITTGLHNLKEVSTIVPATEADVKVAANTAQAEANVQEAAKSNEALKTGSGEVKVVLA